MNNKQARTSGSGWSVGHMLETATHPRLWSGRQRVFAMVALPLVSLAVAMSAMSDGAPKAFQSIALSSDPLYAATSGDKPALALALSVEFPTVGAQYVRGPQDSTDDTYSNANEYLGYYDAEACYTYVNAPTETPATGLTAADYKRFNRSGAAVNRKCADAFSGNFLNWASSSAIDMLRLALSGGDRYIDTTNLTILQRAVIPNGDPTCMWNSTNFPAKQLQRAGGTSGSAFWGAVPQAMATAAGANDIWVGNALNRIYFGTARGGSCGDKSSYRLGVATTGTGIGPVNASSTKPADASNDCAGENGTCSFTGIKQVWYGAGSNWKYAMASGGVQCTNAIFGDPIVGTAKRCYTRDFNDGSWTPTGSSAGLNSDGFFYSRVEVCQRTTDGELIDDRDYKLCTKYPSGNFKPGGVVQKYSDQLRLAAFGYAMEQTASYDNGRYGGVLRAPMKYVGTKTFDINGQENTPTGGNPKAEWNATTGVYFANPEGDTTQATPISGVINYLNKFGRTGPVPGRYKKYDPVSELYYETLRYLQGLQPSTDAISGLTTDMYDGFPIYTTWTDPYGDGRSATGKYGCLKSNIVVIGDINTHDGSRFPRASVSTNIPDLGYWTSVVGDFERGTVRNYTDGQGATRQTGNPNTANGNPRSDAIIGYSYWAHTQDIRGAGWTDQPTKQRPGLRVKTFVFDVNEYGEQSVEATRRNRNQFFTAAKYGGFEADPSNKEQAPFNTFGNPFKRQDETVDNNVWQDSTRPGEASAYYMQSNARGVLNAFENIFGRASSSARSIAGGAIQSKALTREGTTIYQGAFDTFDWSGDLFAIPISVDDGNNVSIGSTPTWTAASRLSALPDPAATRNIVVGNGSGAATVASNFVWTNGISSALQTALNKPSPTAAEDGFGQARLNYLRGARDDDGGKFRNRRGKLLGDIVNSSVVYSGPPSSVISSTTYAGFQKDYLARTPAVFVGANDGMLHAFNATTGDELFGYIPSWVGPHLPALTSPDYIQNHRSYVDGPPTVGEAEVGNAGTKADWRTVLVSGTGAGGRGVFALDVTDPTAFSASKVMWEFTTADDVDMGFVVGQPRIIKLRTSAAAATPTYKWFAAVASGVNSFQPDAAGTFSDTGKPALFLLDLSKAAGEAWVLGTNYYKISIPVDETLAATRSPGVLNFREVLNANRVTTQIFMGDLHGRMWKLDFRTHGSGEWTTEKLFGFYSGTTPLPLFIAKDGSGNPQPISMAPTLVASEAPSGIYVAFGTGKYLEADDRTSTAQNSFYVVYDNATTTPDSSSPTSIISGRARLKAGSFDSSTGNVSVDPFVWGRPTTDTDATHRSGWYIDYPTNGERQISSATLVGDTLIFGSLIPGATGGVNTCGVAGGSGREYRLNVDTGDGQSRVSTVGIFGQPLVTELESASLITKSDNTGRRTRTIKSTVFNQGSSGIGISTTQTTTIIAGRLSWRQINNYQDLKNATP
ncbi:pilus assembly protein [Variovorax saccharolyticus]|uniref:pilus assembly protein n=1 Tax=Variovorax saccharolyticus TaxID=3053516 RepID=UPI0025764ED8|nr:PilC/PilY family type IV pilus protein [Variovorax sp. J22R187]MDM0019953.1 PilC/PilY family type IV pilus protein [Variovorax sp. J22R187]